MNSILLRKKDSIFKITKSLNQNPKIKSQTSDESQPLENYKNSIDVFNVMLFSKQASNNDLFFTRGRHTNTDIYYVSQNYFHLTKKTVRIISNVSISFKQNLRDIIILFHGLAGLDQNLEEWEELCRKV